MRSSCTGGYLCTRARSRLMRMGVAAGRPPSFRPARSAPRTGRDGAPAAPARTGRAACRREGDLYAMATGVVTPACRGLALAPPRRRGIAIDGDGSLLLNLGALTTVANAAPGRLIVLVFDKRRYASTGGLATATAG